MEAKTRHIEDLLEAYFEGNTNLQEENKLRKYFSAENVATTLEIYKPLFAYISEERGAMLRKLSTEEEFVFYFPSSEEKIRNKNVIKWSSITASLIILITISGIFFQRYQQQQNEAATLAFTQTKQVLMKVSSEFNFGFQNLEYLQELDKTTPFFNLKNK